MTTEPDNTLAFLAQRESGSRDRAGLVSKQLDLNVLRERFEDFMGKLQSLVDTDAHTVGAFRLEEIEFSAELTASGEFKLLGTGIGVEGKSAITFTLRRRASGGGTADAGQPG